jgi:hypothetical protein
MEKREKQISHRKTKKKEKRERKGRDKREKGKEPKRHKRRICGRPVRRVHVSCLWSCFFLATQAQHGEK